MYRMRVAKVTIVENPHHEDVVESVILASCVSQALYSCVVQQRCAVRTMCSPCKDTRASIHRVVWIRFRTQRFAFNSSSARSTSSVHRCALKEARTTGGHARTTGWPLRRVTRKQVSAWRPGLIPELPAPWKCLAAAPSLPNHCPTTALCRGERPRTPGRRPSRGLMWIRLLVGPSQPSEGGSVSAGQAGGLVKGDETAWRRV